MLLFGRSGRSSGARERSQRGKYLQPSRYTDRSRLRNLHMPFCTPTSGARGAGALLARAAAYKRRREPSGRLAEPVDMKRFLRTLDSTPRARLEQQSGGGPPGSRASTGGRGLPLKRVRDPLSASYSRFGVKAVPFLALGFGLERATEERAPGRCRPCLQPTLCPRYYLGARRLRIAHGPQRR